MDYGGWCLYFHVPYKITSLELLRTTILCLVCDGIFLMGINQNHETYIQKCALYVFSLIVRKAFFM